MVERAPVRRRGACCEGRHCGQAGQLCAGLGAGVFSVDVAIFVVAVSVIVCIIIAGVSVAGVSLVAGFLVVVARCSVRLPRRVRAARRAGEPAGCSSRHRCVGTSAGRRRPAAVAGRRLRRLCGGLVRSGPHERRKHRHGQPPVVEVGHLGGQGKGDFSDRCLCVWLHLSTAPEMPLLCVTGVKRVRYTGYRRNGIYAVSPQSRAPCSAVSVCVCVLPSRLSGSHTTQSLPFYTEQQKCKAINHPPLQPFSPTPGAQNFKEPPVREAWPPFAPASVPAFAFAAAQAAQRALSAER